MSYHDLTFQAMGGEVRLLIGDPLSGSPPAHEAVERGRVRAKLLGALVAGG